MKRIHCDANVLLRSQADASYPVLHETRPVAPRPEGLGGIRHERPTEIANREGNPAVQAALLPQVPSSLGIPSQVNILLSRFHTDDKLSFVRC